MINFIWYSILVLLHPLEILVNITFYDKKINFLKGEHEKIDSNSNDDVTVSSRYFQLFCFIRYTYTFSSI